jgi:hypothetical protein
MLIPTTGTLLRAVRIELTNQVLPELPDGEARRQLKAALHILSRLERCWDRQVPYLEADNADLAHTLDIVLGELGDGPDAAAYRQLTARLAETRVHPPQAPIGDPGVTDRLQRLMPTNYVLQEILVDLEAALRANRQSAGPSDARQRAEQALDGLHRRLVNRAAAAAGTDDDS